MSRGDGEAAAHPARLYDAIERHWVAHTLQRLWAAVLHTLNAASGVDEVLSVMRDLACYLTYLL